MAIEPLSTTPGSLLTAAEVPVPLSQRVGTAERRPDPDLDAFYEALLAWESSGSVSVWQFLRSYQRAGERPYATSDAQLTVLQTVLGRLSDEGLKDCDIYGQTYQAFTSVFGIKGFVAQFSQQVFDPQANADLDEASSW